MADEREEGGGPSDAAVKRPRGSQSAGASAPVTRNASPVSGAGSVVREQAPEASTSGGGAASGSGKRPVEGGSGGGGGKGGKGGRGGKGDSDDAVSPYHKSQHFSAYSKSFFCGDVDVSE